MSEEATTKIDRTGWDFGPWDREPDRWEGEFSGFPALAVRQQRGNWCGYVAVPPGHPWHGIDGTIGGLPGTDDGYAAVHGGVTYANSCSGRICHVPKPGEPDNVWWLGFDCHHAWDIAPGDAVYWKKQGYENPPFDSDDSFYRDLAYVQCECQELAEQAQAAARPPSDNQERR